MKARFYPIEKRSSTGECTSEAGSNESCNYDEEELHSEYHDNTARYTPIFPVGEATNEKLTKKKGKIPAMRES